MICLMLDESDLSFFRSPPFKGFPYLTLPLPSHFFSKQQCQYRLFDFGFTQSSLFFIVCYGVTISYPNLNFSLHLVKILVTEFLKVSPLLRPVNGSDFEIRPAPPIFGGLSFPTCFLYLSLAPMKRSVRPLFSALLFAFFAATLICRVAIRRRSFSFSSAIAELGSSGLITEEIVFNETLLEFAAIDPGEPKSKQEVDLISDYDNTRRSHRRHFSSMSRPIEQQQQQRHGNRDIASKFPVTLRSPQVYRYWSEFRRNLRLWARRRAYEPNIMLDLITLVKNPIDSHNGVVSISSKRYSSCAVVGNSGTLLNSQYGGLIDKHEIVIRLNNAKTERFEKKVGSKTNISFINSNILHQCGRRESCYCHPYGETVSIVMYICQPIHVLDYTVCKPSHRAPLVITDPRFDVLCARIVKYYSVKKFLEEKRTEGFVDWSKGHEGSLFHYSSGMQAVMLAVGICEKVSVFGFGKLNSTKHHYHTNQKAELKLHDYEAEYRLYRDLENNPRAIPFLSKEFKIPLVQVYH